MTAPSSIDDSVERRTSVDALQGFSVAVFRAAGADEATAQAATKAMLHGSRLGVDSHGIRLLPHYIRVIEGGRVNGTPNMTFGRKADAAATLDADHGHGALAAYTAMDEAISLARKFGIGSVAIQRSSHFGPAGAYAIEAAHEGLIGLAFCNSDAFVRLHGGAERFHGTNPIAVAVPSGEADPWLFDMATSSVPYNRVRLYQSIGAPLPEGVASLPDGEDTTDADRADMLAPLGGMFGFKGAGLAGLVEIFSAVLSGMKLSAEILPMEGDDVSTPRDMGAFVLALEPAAFVDRTTFLNGMQRYLGSLRNSSTARGQTVMAPGDREWAVARRRQQEGIPIDPHTEMAFRKLAEVYSVPFPETNGASPSY